MNGVAIPRCAQKRLRARIQQRARQPALRGAIRELINREVIAQDEPSGLTKNAEYLLQLDWCARLAVVYYSKTSSANLINDAECRRNTNASRLDRQGYKARHILIEQEDQAKAAIADPKKREARRAGPEMSKDEGTTCAAAISTGKSNHAGEAVFDVMVKLERAEISAREDAVRWHVIQLDDVRAIKHPRSRVAADRRPPAPAEIDRTCATCVGEGGELGQRPAACGARRQSSQR